MNNTIPVPSQHNLKFRQPLFKGDEFQKFHYWGFISGEWVNPIQDSNTPTEELSEQWTGVTDKQGREVYVNDFLALPEYGDGTYSRVKYSNKRGMFYILYIHSLNSDSRTAYVIGNYYQNPELI